MIRVNLCPGLTEDVKRCLASTGVRSVLDLIRSDLEELVVKVHHKISYKELIVFKKMILAQQAAFPVTAADMYNDLVNIVSILPTSYKHLDELLCGGIYTTEITEIVGKSGTGKSQLCMRTAVNVACDMKASALFIDNGCSFDPHTLEMLLDERTDVNEEVSDICSRIHCAKAFTPFELLNVLDETKEKIAQQEDSFHSHLKLIVVDSFAALMQCSDHDYQTVNGLLVHASRYLKFLATEYSIAVLVTNINVTSDTNVIQRAGLGLSWQHIPNTRIQLIKDKGDESRADINTTDGGTIAVLVKSSRQACLGRCVTVP